MSKFKFTPPSAATHIETPTSPGDGTVSDLDKIFADLIHLINNNSATSNYIHDEDDEAIRLAKIAIQNLLVKSRTDTGNIQNWVDRGLESTNTDVWYRCLQMINDELRKDSNG